MFRYKRHLIFIILLLLIAVFILHLNLNSSYISYIHDFTNINGNSFRSRIYIPPTLNPNEKIPTAIIIPGIVSNKELQHVLSVELVKRRICVIAIDILGNGEKIDNKPVESYDGTNDLMAILNSNIKFIDYSKLFLIGHSFGSGIAVNFGEKYPEKFSGIIGIGFDYLSERIPNFLFGSGLYDEMYPPYQLLEKANKVFKKDMKINVLYGNFKDKTARKLIYSPAINHVAELKDNIIIKNIIEWIENILYGKTLSPIKTTEQLNQWCIYFLIWSIFFLALLAFYFIKLKYTQVSGTITKGHKYFLICWRILILVVLGLIFFENVYFKNVLSPILITDIGIIGCLFIFFAGIIYRININFKALFKTIGAILGAIIIIVIIVSLYRFFYVVINYNFPFSLILYLPELIISVLLIVPGYLIDSIRPFIVISYTVSPSFHPALVMIWLMEVILPGWSYMIYYCLKRKLFLNKEKPES